MGFCQIVIAAASVLSSDPVSWQAREVQATRWPFSNLNRAIQLTSDTALSLEKRIDRAHTVFEDFVFNEGVDRVYDRRLYPSDQYLATNTGPRWAAIDGGWNSIVVSAPSEMPLGVHFGIQTIYDPTPHTPGLYQFTEIDWSRYPFTITITHKAWVLVESLPTGLTNSSAWATDRGSSIPSPSGAFILGLGALGLSVRKRSQ